MVVGPKEWNVFGSEEWVGCLGIRKDWSTVFDSTFILIVKNEVWAVS